MGSGDSVTPTRSEPARMMGNLALSAATLMLEVILNRVFALSQGYHFAFMTISIALLGLGAGGTFLALFPGQEEKGAVQPQKDVPGGGRQERGEHALVLAAVGFALTTLGGYLIGNTLPLDLYRIAWQRVQFLYLLALYVVLSLPFFCSGVALGLLLRDAAKSHVTYAANLIGSAVGALAALGAMQAVDEPMAIVLAAAGGLFAATCFACGGKRSSLSRCVAWMGGWSICAAAIIGLATCFPGWFAVRLSRYCALSYALQFPDARLRYSRWDAFSHVDVVESSAIHVAPGLSLAYSGAAPVQLGLYVDTHARAAILNDERAVIDEWSRYLLQGLPFYLRPYADVLVLEPGGGLDVAVARSLGARHITAISFDPLESEAVGQFGAGLYADPDVEVVARSPRSFAGRAQRLGGRFDIVDLALTDAQQMILSGAYTLSEDYRYTLQAFRDYMSLLKPGGLLVVQRWLQMPPSESLRAWATAVESLERYSQSAPEQSLVAVRSWATMVILVKNGPFSEGELQVVRHFCAERQFDLVYVANMREEEANRYNEYPGALYWHAFQDLLFSPRETFYRQQDYDVRPPTDDRPFFLHFFKWRQAREILQGLGRTWQPFGGGGYLILIVLLVVAALACTGLMMFPLWFAGRVTAGSMGGVRWQVMAYFGCLGLGYLGIEIPLIQRFVLLVDHPAIAFVTVVSLLLASSGIGSLLSNRLRAEWTIPALALYVLSSALWWPPICDLALGASLSVRLVVASALLAPVGIGMGVPFPAGLAVMCRPGDASIPWVWGVNGCVSVLASILASIGALAFGFCVVTTLAAMIYLVAWVLLLAERRRKTRMAAA